jgi:hypothetical protein
MRRIGLKNCPYCGSPKVYLSSPKTLGERLPTLFLLRLVRCHGCMRRHVRPLLLPAPKYPELHAVPTKPIEASSAKKTEKRSA